MSNIIENTEYFLTTTQQVLSSMFGVSSTVSEMVEKKKSLQTDKQFIVSIFFTGTVYGEYILAMNESTAMQIIGEVPGGSPEDLDYAKTEISEAFSEVLNMIVGESITQLHKTYSKLTFATPRVFFGQVRYPMINTGSCTLTCDAGDIECHFYLDCMRLDLATSYEEAVHALLEANEKLKNANRCLQEQQAQLVHSEKMASVGMLAAGVAHEINNPLMFVDTNFSSLTEYTEAIESMFAVYESLASSITHIDESLKGPLQKVYEQKEEEDIDFVMEDTKNLLAETREGLDRIKAIVQGLKEFSHADASGYNETDLNQVIENTLKLVSNQLKYHCEVIKNLNEIPLIFCNKGEVGQILVNLLVNAAQAIPDKGTIKIESAVVDDEVIIKVEDDGSGMSSEQMEKIFNPFYTTKPVGQGTGLGLSISYGIMKRHQGDIEVESEEGKGTVFTLHFPLDIKEPLPSEA